MPIPPNPFHRTHPDGAKYKFAIGDTVRVLPTAGKWTDFGHTNRDYSRCVIEDRFYPPNLYGADFDGVGGEAMPCYEVRSLSDGSVGFPWEVDLEAI